MKCQCGLLLIFFFFKQKTANEMRMSDWSSDVCSSDLAPATPACTVHCADHAKDSQIAKVPAVPMLSGIAIWPLLERLESTPIARVGALDVIRNARSEGRRAGKACVSMCIYPWSPSP